MSAHSVYSLTAHILNFAGDGRMGLILPYMILFSK